MSSFSKLLRSYKVRKMKRCQFFKSQVMNLEVYSTVTISLHFF